jgi:hypothetical protein
MHKSLPQFPSFSTSLIWSIKWQWRVMQIMDLVIQYFPASCCLLPLRPKYHPQYSVVVNPPCVFPLLRQTKFQNNKYNMQVLDVLRTRQ